MRRMVLHGLITLIWPFMVKHKFYWTYIVFSRGHRSKFIWSCLLMSFVTLRTFELLCFTEFGTLVE